MPANRKFRCRVKRGHEGAGKHRLDDVFVYAPDIIEAMRRASKLPGVKKSCQRGRLVGIDTIEEVK
jgi:hypothetical protein